MLKLLRASLQSLTTSVSKAYKTFVAYGRMDEELTGKLMQHYGFSSMPTADMELITFQIGNNNFSVAENDGNNKPINLPSGAVSLYLPSADGTEPKVSISMYKDSASPHDPLLTIDSDKAVLITAGQSLSILVSGSGDIDISCNGKINMQGGALTVSA